MNASNFLSPEEKKAVVSAIVEAELNTSGEIRVHIEKSCGQKDVLDRAAEIFAILKMHKTELRNGVLIYISVDNHKFAILGDVGINQKVSANFWDEIKLKMLNQFKEGNFCNGICEAVLLSGEQLKHHFPYQEGDVNELPNEISFS